ncbi:substrate-binding domain-containing protein [Streptomyces sp. NPDC048419]|uniref:substrate-binding domain-containing protein n=1 Tax=Streptomyces sp. NPDC048419 TaxID=3365547 RepID=UPI00371D367A
MSLGHRDIAHIDGGRAPGTAERRRGYRTPMNRHGLADHIRILPGGLTAQPGSTAANTLLTSAARPGPALAFNDACATGALNTLFRSGLSVPHDISVVGFDDSRLAPLPHVDLTTVAQGIPRLAELAVAHITNRLENSGTPTGEDVVAPHLVVRGTTTAAG